MRAITSRKTAIPVILLLLLTTTVQAAKTPSDVFMQTERGLAEVELIRQAKGITEVAKKAGVQKKKSPLHVFGKCVEVIEKVARLQKMEGLIADTIPDIPLRKITPSEVYQCTQTAIDGLQAVKKQLGLSASIKRPARARKKTPSHVYRNMWQLSYSLDTLVGQISPSEVFRNVQVMRSELALVANAQGASLDGKLIEVSGKKPGDVLINCFQGLIQLREVQRSMNIAKLRVPQVPGGKILPSDVYDCTNMQLTELHVIKTALGITQSREKIAAPTGKTPSDVFAEMTLYREQIKQLTEKL